MTIWARLAFFFDFPMCLLMVFSDVAELTFLISRPVSRSG